MAMINVLMCGGRRTGKTSVLTAIQENVMKLFPHGDIVLDMPDSGRMVNYRTETTKIFGYDYEDESTFIANQGTMEFSQIYGRHLRKGQTQRNATKEKSLFRAKPVIWSQD